MLRLWYQHHEEWRLSLLADVKAEKQKLMNRIPPIVSNQVVLKGALQPQHPLQAPSSQSTRLLAGYWEEKIYEQEKEQFQRFKTRKKLQFDTFIANKLNS